MFHAVLMVSAATGQDAAAPWSAVRAGRTLAGRASTTAPRMPPYSEYDRETGERELFERSLAPFSDGRQRTLQRDGETTITP